MMVAKKIRDKYKNLRYRQKKIDNKKVFKKVSYLVKKFQM